MASVFLNKFTKYCCDETILLVELYMNTDLIKVLILVAFNLPCLLTMFVQLIIVGATFLMVYIVNTFNAK